MDNGNVGASLTTLGNRVYAAGTGMSLVSALAIGSSPAWVEELPRFGSFQQTLIDMFAAADDDIWAISTGVDGIYHYDGALWTRVTTAVSGLDCVAIGASSSSDVWIASRDSALTWNAGLSTFLATATGFSAAKDITSGASGSAWATDGNAIRQFDAGWKATPAITGTVNALAAISANDVFAVGNNNNFLRWTGSDWETVATPAELQGKALSAVWASGPTDVFVAGDRVIAHWGGGTNWVVWPFDGETFLELYGHSADDVFASGVGGVLQHFDGARWAPIRSRTTLDIPALAGAVDTTYFAGGFAPVGLHRDVGW
jgi:hypothetical protein